MCTSELPLFGLFSYSMVIKVQEQQFNLCNEQIFDLLNKKNPTNDKQMYVKETSNSY